MTKAPIPSENKKVKRQHIDATTTQQLRTDLGRSAGSFVSSTTYLSYCGLILLGYFIYKAEQPSLDGHSTFKLRLLQSSINQHITRMHVSSSQLDSRMHGSLEPTIRSVYGFSIVGYSPG